MIPIRPFIVRKCPTIVLICPPLSFHYRSFTVWWWRRALESVFRIFFIVSEGVFIVLYLLLESAPFFFISKFYARIVNPFLLGVSIILVLVKLIFNITLK